VGFADRVRGWMKGGDKRRAPSKSTASASRASTKDLEEFATSRRGVEAYLEPRTAIYSITLLLVAGDGEYLRRPIADRDQAAALCDRFELPLYDAARVGYPKRMRDYDRGARQAPVRDEDLPPWPGDDVEAPGPPPPPIDENGHEDGNDGRRTDGGGGR
jgi:hypothetical protein